MDHIKHIKANGDTKPNPLSPGSGVSQSKFLSPCRRVGLKRKSTNKFILKFRNIENISDSTKLDEGIETEDSNLKSQSEYNITNHNNAKLVRNTVEEAVDYSNIRKSSSLPSEHPIETIHSAETQELADNLLKSEDCDDIVLETVFNNNKNCKEIEKYKDFSLKYDTSCLNHNSNLVKNKNMEKLPENSNSLKNSNRSPDLMKKSPCRKLKTHDDFFLPNEVNEETNTCDKQLKHPLDAENNADLIQQNDLNEDTVCIDPNMITDINSSTLSHLSNESNVSESNGSKCDDSDMNSSIFLEEERSSNSHKAGSKSKMVKRFKNPLKKIKLDGNQTQNVQVIAMRKKILEKEKKIADMKMTIANSAKHNIDQLDGLILKWRSGCQDALNELLAEIHRRGKDDYTMDKLLQELNIPLELVRYNETNEEFY